MAAVAAAAGAERLLAAAPPEWRLYLLPARLATFQGWPFTEGCLCTPRKMAAAGFVHCPSENSPDLAQCFFCFKELEGWEPEDDPVQEHRKHSGGCAFLALQRDVAELSLQDFLRLDKERTKNMIQKKISEKVTEIEEVARRVRREIEHHVR